jgi:hypothetical protein
MVQNFFDQGFDVYTRRARLSPALITILPIALTVVLLFPTEFTLLGIIASLLICGGGTVLLTQIGRDSGKQKEAHLFNVWGGKPTTRYLRHGGTTNPILLSRRHSQLQSLFPDIQVPSTTEESADPVAADVIYDFFISCLREKTRNREDFYLIFDENCNYGFRRNLWGLKPHGLALSILGLTISVGVLILHLHNWKAFNINLVIACVVTNLTFLTIWCVVIKPCWVKISAESYATRLLESCERLEIPVPSSNP